MGARASDDDRPTVELGPRASFHAAEASASAAATAVHAHAPAGGGETGETGEAGEAGETGDVDDADSAIALATADVAFAATAAAPQRSTAEPAAARRLTAEPAGAAPAASPGPQAPIPPSPVHDLPTQQLPPRKKSASSAPSQSSSRVAPLATADSPLDAMRLDEMQRTRVFLKAVLGICLGGTFVALVARGDAIARNALLAGTGGALVGACWLLFALRGKTSYDPRRMLVPGLLVVAGSMTGVYYWGAASPVAAMLVYGIYFFSLGTNARITALLYAIISIIHGALGIGIVAGVLRDRGIISMAGLRTLDQIAIISIYESLYLFAFLTARASQRVTLDAMTKLQRAARHVAQRDALLAEARAELDRALKIGGPGRFTEQVIGSFRLGVLIGRGGMGEVYEAHREAHGTAGRREAAVKLLHPGTLGDPTAVQRFLREATIAARLDCPHVVRVLEVGTTASELPFIAMERLRGSDLAVQLRRHRRLGLAPATLIAEQVALGLEAARAAGIVHRDLKPHNIFLTEEAGVRCWKILDFGVSKTGGSGTLTKGHVVGTPAYMAPEQARGESVDHRADVYSLAAILYRAVTGHPAFTGKDVPTTLYEVVYRIPTQPSLLARLPADVDRVLAIGLAKRLDDRFATALELARWFAAAIQDALEPEQRRRADDVIARHPWGTRSGAAAASR